MGTGVVWLQKMSQTFTGERGTFPCTDKKGLPLGEAKSPLVGEAGWSLLQTLALVLYFCFRWVDNFFLVRQYLLLVHMQLAVD